MVRARLGAALLIVGLSHAAARADVTLTMTNTIEGPMAALTGGSAPSMTLRIQGQKSRTDMEVMGRTFATISDVAGKQMVVLDPGEKTVRRMPLDPPGVPAAGPTAMPKMDVSVEPTGRTEQIAGQACEEFRIAIIMDMSQVGTALANPDVRDAMKDMRMVMRGATWISRSSPAATEFLKFQESARAAGLANPTNLFGNQGAPDPIAQAVARGEGLPCLSEIEMNYEGTGPMIEMMKKMGTMKVTSRLTAISLDPIAADMFVVPSDYQEAPAQNPSIPRH
jgi:hypothetical protein